MKIEASFAKKTAYNGVKFVERPSKLTGGTAIVPENWSGTATSIIAQKYFRLAQVPSKTVSVAEEGVPKWLQRQVPAKDATFGAETDARQVFHRLAGCWAYWGWISGAFADEASAKAYYDDMRAMLAQQIGAPNSPQWFNTGLYWAYGITGPAQGHYYVDHKTGELQKSPDAYGRPAPHACYIQSVSDDLLNEGGIFDFFTREARIFKFGAGSGANFSLLRGEGEPLSGGGKSSGLMSFLKVGDRAAGAIKSGGTTRRAAKMVVLNVDHPDIEEFVSWKVKEEHKVASLVAGSIVCEKHLNLILTAAHDATIAEADRFDLAKNEGLKKALKEAKTAGVPGGAIQQAIDLGKQGTTHIDFDVMDLGWQSEAYNTVSGQNSNNSVRVTDDFMRAVEMEGDWNLLRRTDGSVHKTITARSLWDKIALAAWQCADPGIQFDTTLNDWHTCPADGRLNASNPCSEYQFLDDTACNLASINLAKFLLPGGKFDVDKFVKASSLWTLTLEISVTMSQLPAKNVAERTFDYRTLGLGYANLGTLLMRMGLAYDSAEGRSRAAAITAIMHGTANLTSAKMAGEVGPFPRYEANKDGIQRVMRNHRRAVYAELDGYEGLSINPVVYNPGPENEYLWNAARLIWDDALETGEKSGYRNAQVTVLAPTGTIGLVMDCDTTGVEPDFSLVKFKTLAGGGSLKIVNESVNSALENLGYSKEQARAIETHAKGTGEFSQEDITLLLKGDVDAETIEKIANSITSTINFEMAAAMASVNLRHIGLTTAVIEEISERVWGTMSIEGAPFIKEEHLAVFDCANKCGTNGTRFISARGHIDMMAAVQPFLSGSISKTVNLPSSATIEDVGEAYRYSWSVGVKAVALYRDSSKLSQPLSAQYDVDIDEMANLPSTAKAIAAAEAFLKMGQKRRLPARVGGYRQKFAIGGHEVFLRTGEYQDGTIGEIFLDMNKEGATLGAIMNNFAIAISMGLQYGVPLDAYVERFAGTKFEPNGPVVGHDNIKMASSILDVIFRELAISYLGRHDMAQIPPVYALEAAPAEHPHNPVSAGVGFNGHSTNGHSNGVASTGLAVAEKPSILSDSQIAIQQGYEGDPCTNCNAFKMVKSGTCSRCSECGTTTGCS